METAPEAIHWLPKPSWPRVLMILLPAFFPQRIRELGHKTVVCPYEESVTRECSALRGKRYDLGDLETWGLYSSRSGPTTAIVPDCW